MIIDAALNLTYRAVTQISDYLCYHDAEGADLTLRTGSRKTRDGSLDVTAPFSGRIGTLKTARERESESLGSG